MNPGMRILVAYDVPDDRRRRRLARVLEGYGDRIQGSVFEACLHEDLTLAMIQEVEEVIDEALDRVIIARLCAACVGRQTRLGVSRDDPDPGAMDAWVV